MCAAPAKLRLSFEFWVRSTIALDSLWMGLVCRKNNDGTVRNSKTRLEHRGAQADEEEARGENQRMLCYNLGLFSRRYRLGVRTEDSQSSNPGSIPGSATNSLSITYNIFPHSCFRR